MTMTVTDQLTLGPPAVAAMVPLSRTEANRLLTDWGHTLGPCHRPFAQYHHALIVHGRPVSLAVSASLVSPTVTDETGTTWPRSRCVEQARLCTRPGDNWATRVMLRLWRELVAPTWPAAGLYVAYATPGTPGHIYRTDGWTRVREVRPARPGKGSTWSTSSATDRIGDGRKTLWIYRAIKETQP